MNDRTKFSFRLTEHCRFHSAVQIFESLHQLSPPYLHSIFQFSKDVTGQVSHRLFVPKVFINYGKELLLLRDHLVKQLIIQCYWGCNIAFV